MEINQYSIKAELGEPLTTRIEELINILNNNIYPALATFKISQIDGVGDLKDTNIGESVELTSSDEVGPISNGGQLLGKLISLTLSGNDNGKRLATVLLCWIYKLGIKST